MSNPIYNLLDKVTSLYITLKKNQVNPFWVFPRYLGYKLQHKNIIPHQKTTIVGLKNIETGGSVSIGITACGTDHKNDPTIIRAEGKLIFKGDFSIGRGCRFDIGPRAKVVIGKHGYINYNTNIIITKQLEIGDSCAIGWNCQFLDTDFHEINYDDKKREEDQGIKIGNHVWIGCNSKIYKNSVIANSSVVASDSVVKGRFEEENVLIGGNPAHILKRNISWK